METTVSDRIRKAIKWLIGKGYANNQEGIGILLGYTNKSSFSQVVNNPGKIPSGFFDRLVSIDCELNKVWLETGEGEMLKSNQPSLVHPDQSVSQTTYFESLILSQQRTIENLSETIKNLTAK